MTRPPQQDNQKRPCSRHDHPSLHRSPFSWLVVPLAPEHLAHGRLFRYHTASARACLRNSAPTNPSPRIVSPPLSRIVPREHTAMKHVLVPLKTPSLLDRRERGQQLNHCAVGHASSFLYIVSPTRSPFSRSGAQSSKTCRRRSPPGKDCCPLKVLFMIPSRVRP